MRTAQGINELETERLRLRQWRDDDLAPLLEMTRDPEVMAHFPALLTPDEARSILGRLRTWIDEHGHGFWAVEVKATGAFAGFCGVKAVTFAAPFTPAFETGWRFVRAHWGNGYATEAARAAVSFGFTELGLDEIVAFLLPANRRSAAVCERLGMRRDPAGDFDHPMFAEGQRAVGGELLRRHVLYRLAKPA
jgi:ribosomal-protein-alanine N-acetyltransferase